MLDPHWWNRAICTDLDRELFFNEQNSSLVKQAKAVCARCPVRIECFLDAAESDSPGIQGGMTSNERIWLREFIRQEGKSISLSVALDKIQLSL